MFRAAGSTVKGIQSMRMVVDGSSGTVAISGFILGVYVAGVMFSRLISGSSNGFFSSLIGYPSEDFFELVFGLAIASGEQYQEFLGRAADAVMFG